MNGTEVAGGVVVTPEEKAGRREALSLQVFPKHPEADDTYYINAAWAPACITAQDKRFTEAELAAEYWKATSDILDPRNPVGLAVERRQTMERFASLPHHDEEEEA